jgi:hypothetical protein
MANFAKIGINNEVIALHVVHNNVLKDSNGIEKEELGIEFLKSLYGENIQWKQTSFNTLGGIHLLGGIPFRKNYGRVGYTYDVNRDAFISPKPYNSWILNEDKCIWEAPIPCPETYNLNLKTEDNMPIKDPYRWDEETLNWIQ